MCLSVQDISDYCVLNDVFINTMSTGGQWSVASGQWPVDQSLRAVWRVAIDERGDDRGSQWPLRSRLALCIDR